MIGIVGILTIVTPLIGIVFSLIGLFFSNKNKKIYALFFSVSIATLAYLYISPSTDDLYRHHLEIVKLSYMTSEQITNLLLTDIEKLPILIELLVMKMNDVNLLQFITTFISYFLILSLCINNLKEEDSFFEKTVIIFFSIISVRFINIVSNIWFTLALCFFSYGIYYDYIENKKKKSIIFYALSILTHSSTLFALFVLMIFKIFKNNLDRKKILILFISFLLINYFVVFLNNHFGYIGVVKIIYSYYTPYFLNKTFEAELNPTRLVIMQFIRLIPFVLIYIFNYQKASKNQIDNLVMCFSIVSLSLLFSTTFAMRFVTIVPLIGHNTLRLSFSEYKKGKKINMILIYTTIIISIIWLFYQIWSFRKYEFDSLEYNIFKNIFSIIFLNN